MTEVDIAEVPVDTADAAETAETAEAAETAAETTDTTEAAVDAAAEPEAASAEPPTPAPKRRGRPVGSKNRVKEPPQLKAVPKAVPKPKAKKRPALHLLTTSQQRPCRSMCSATCRPSSLRT
jgi:hypothetical protein